MPPMVCGARSAGAPRDRPPPRPLEHQPLRQRRPQTSSRAALRPKAASDAGLLDLWPGASLRLARPSPAVARVTPEASAGRAAHDAKPPTSQAPHAGSSAGTALAPFSSFGVCRCVDCERIERSLEDLFAPPVVPRMIRGGATPTEPVAERAAEDRTLPGGSQTCRRNDATGRDRHPAISRFKRSEVRPTPTRRRGPRSAEV
jgi:hypothetical protein